MPEQRFAMVPIREVGRTLVADFAERTWGEAATDEIGLKWWLTSQHADARAAVDEGSGQIAGMVVAVPSFWPLPDGSEVRTVSICGWYVAPDYAGRGLGKLLVESFRDSAPGQNALSISEAAIRNFAKLGWTGPFRTQLLLLPLPRLRLRPRSKAFKIQSWSVRGGDPSLDLAAVLDRIEATRPTDQIRRRRSAEDWRSHLRVRPSRTQHFHVVTHYDQPIGYFVIRATDDESGRVYRTARLHYVSDIVLNRTDDGAVRFLLRSIGPSAPRSAGALLLCTSDRQVADAAVAAGWLSEASRWIGPRLAVKVPLYMLGGSLTALDGDSVRMSFTDSDVDLNI